MIYVQRREEALVHQPARPSLGAPVSIARVFRQPNRESDVLRDHAEVNAGEAEVDPDAAEPDAVSPRPDSIHVEQEFVRRHARSLEHAHVYLGPTSPNARGTCSVSFKLRAAGPTSLRGSAFLTFAIATAILATAIAAALGATSELRELSAVFLLAPPAAIALTTRAAEHPLATSMLLGPRFLAWVVAGCSISTAVVLRLAAQDSTAAACLAGLGFVALLVSTVLGVGWGLAQRSRPDGSSP